MELITGGGKNLTASEFDATKIFQNNLHFCLIIYSVFHFRPSLTFESRRSIYSRTNGASLLHVMAYKSGAPFTLVLLAYNRLVQKCLQVICALAYYKKV
jgi:hypothetical protein